MNSVLILALLVAADTRPTDGTLLFLENGNPVVEAVTKQEVTHVGVILNEAESTWLYEAIPGKVRRVALAEYYQEISAYNRGRKKPTTIQLREPVHCYSRDEIDVMRRFLNEQIDRRYSIKNYVKATPGDGTHCAELTANALNTTGRFQLSSTYSITPGALAVHVNAHYAPGVAISMPPPPQKSWCQRSREWWGGLFSWCGWSCGEAWSFCR